VRVFAKCHKDSCETEGKRGYTLLLRKTSVIVKIYQISFHVFVCVFLPETS
jgi:hypothetical protein